MYICSPVVLCFFRRDIDNICAPAPSLKSRIRALNTPIRNDIRSHNYSLSKSIQLPPVPLPSASASHTTPVKRREVRFTPFDQESRIVDGTSRVTPAKRVLPTPLKAQLREFWSRSMLLPSSDGSSNNTKRVDFEKQSQLPSEKMKDSPQSNVVAEATESVSRSVVSIPRKLDFPLRSLTPRSRRRGRVFIEEENDDAGNCAGVATTEDVGVPEQLHAVTQDPASLVNSVRETVQLAMEGVVSSCVDEDKDSKSAVVLDGLSTLFGSSVEEIPRDLSEVIGEEIRKKRIVFLLDCGFIISRRLAFPESHHESTARQKCRALWSVDLYGLRHGGCRLGECLARSGIVDSRHHTASQTISSSPL